MSFTRTSPSPSRSLDRRLAAVFARTEIDPSLLPLAAEALARGRRVEIDHATGVISVDGRPFVGALSPRGDS